MVWCRSVSSRSEPCAFVGKFAPSEQVAAENVRCVIPLCSVDMKVTSLLSQLRSGFTAGVLWGNAALLSPLLLRLFGRVHKLMRSAVVHACSGRFLTFTGHDLAGTTVVICPVGEV
jgi:hypothetical protein